ncbi:MAG: hemolysin family protein [Kiloniellales bacterium]
MSVSSGSRPPRPEGVGDDPSSSTWVSGPGALGRILRDWWRRLTWWRNDDGETALRDALEEFMGPPEAEQAPADAEDRELLVNLLNFRKQTAEDVMVPRVDIVAVDADTGLAELVALVNRTYHSRLPVYRESLDDVIGMVHIKDVLAAYRRKRGFRLRDIVRQVLFVAPSMRVVDLLLQMQQTRNHMALVVDEYGGIDGLITIEDLVEEIVGEIEDEFDVVEGPKLVIQPDQTLQADARATIEEFEEMVGPVLSDEERADVDTLGGLVFSLAGRVPSRGELVTHPSGVEFEVLAADQRRIKHLRVRNLPRLPTQRPDHS